jgi:hypothetical protein
MLAYFIYLSSMSDALLAVVGASGGASNAG